MPPIFIMHSSQYFTEYVPPSFSKVNVSFRVMHGNIYIIHFLKYLTLLVKNVIATEETYKENTHAMKYAILKASLPFVY